jgi:hypothetical protein
MAAKQEHDAFPLPGRLRHGRDDGAQVAGGEEIGQAVEKGAERPVLSRCAGQERLVHSVAPGAPHHGAEQREVGLAVAHRALSGGGAAGPDRRAAVSRRVMVP